MKKGFLLVMITLISAIILVACGEAKPTITGANDVTIEFGSTFDPKKGVSANDSKGNDLTADIQVEGTVNTTVAAVYELVYSVQDSQNNKATVTRKVTVSKEEKPLSKLEREKQIVLGFVAFLTTKEGKATIQENGGIVEITKEDPSWTTIKEDYPALNADNQDITIKFGGSTSVEKIAKSLSAQFAPLAGNFIAEHGHTGSGDAFKRTQGEEKDGANGIHIGFASRVFSDTEIKGSAANTHGRLAWDAVVAVVHSSNTLTNITAEQLVAIYNHTTKNWSALGGSNIEIASYTRDASSGTREAFLEGMGLNKKHNEAQLGSTVVETNGAMITSIEGNVSGIGYISLSGLANTTLKGLSFNQVAPTEENVLDDSYGLKRPFNYIIRNYN